MLGTVLIVILILALLGALPRWPQVTPELYAARKKTSKVSREDRQNGECCGSTELLVVAPERS
jgi:hypothetical protein